MPHRTRREAHRHFLDVLRSALHCFVDVHIHARDSRHPGVSVVAHTPGVARVRSDIPLGIEVLHYFRFARDSTSGWYTRTVGYSYRLVGAAELGRQTRDEIFAYQYHPLQTPDVDFPHLHVHSTSVVGDMALARVHFRTGRINLSDFLHVLVRDFGVSPRERYATTYYGILEDTDRLMGGMQSDSSD